MHGCGSQASAPASDAAGRGDAAGMPQTARPCRVGPRCATWQGPNRADAGRRGSVRRRYGRNRRRRGRNRADSARIGRIGLYRPKRPSQAEIQKKKKKKGANAPFDLRKLNLNTQNPRPSPIRPKRLSHSVPHLPKFFLWLLHLSSLCAPSIVSVVCTLHCFSL